MSPIIKEVRSVFKLTLRGEYAQRDPTEIDWTIWKVRHIEVTEEDDDYIYHEVFLNRLGYDEDGVEIDDDSDEEELERMDAAIVQEHVRQERERPRFCSDCHTPLVVLQRRI